MKKRSIAILCSLVIALSCVLLAGCGGGGNADVSESKYVGTWKAVSLSAFGEEDNADEVFDAELILVLNADGTAEFTSDGETATATWSETSDGFKIKGDDVNLKFKEVEGGVEASILGVGILFEQQ